MSSQKFKVQITSGTGHDEENDEPEIYEFDTAAEREAFIKGINLASEVMDGWIDAWIVAEHV